MQIALSKLKINVGKYVDLAEKEDIYITRNGKQVAKIVGTNRDRVAEMRSLFGIAKLPQEYNDPNYDPFYEKRRDERFKA
ncbi:MAG: type II toxin-antitoxin system Phd/YefM family antitoxin [Clostridiales bacterium]|nr:type II toxin-antitoxin system Phd/YefM family antitoxin [Clostridiales bacterium]